MHACRCRVADAAPNNDDAGATSGIGAETARVLAKRGARLVLPARSLKAAAEAWERLRAECPGADVVVLPLDLSSLASVRRFVARFLERGLPLNLLVYVVLVLYYRCLSVATTTTGLFCCCCK
jgi:NAD(P)-dependent dehydrogenase (short-subunit alcohol dehydrogenase family)